MHSFPIRLLIINDLLLSIPSTACTVGALSLGRFVFLPFHRSSLAKAGMPKQNGQTHFAAGDRLAEEASFVLKTNDPAGFTIVDVFAWGALGHAAAFYLLATHSISKAPLPF